MDQNRSIIIFIALITFIGGMGTSGGVGAVSNGLRRLLFFFCSEVQHNMVSICKKSYAS